MTPHPSDSRWIDRAVALALTADGPPYAGVVVRNGAALGEGVNEMHSGDPTAHGEMQAIRDAARRHGRTVLRGATLYASAEPCPMCLTAAGAVGIARVVFAATAKEAAAIGDDYGGSGAFVEPVRAWTGRPLTTCHHPHPDAVRALRR